MTNSKLRDLEKLMIDITDLENTKQLLADAVRQEIKHKGSAQRLCFNIARCTTVMQLQVLFYNSLLKFEGMGTIK